MPGSYSPFARRAYALPPVRGHKPPSPSKGGGDIIRSIFADGTDGFYFDFSKTDRLFQNLVGTPADGAGENIHLAYESHSWQGRTFAQEIASRSPALSDDFSTYADTAAMVSAGWVESNGGVATLSSGQLKLTNGLAAFGRVVSPSFSTTNGATHKVRVKNNSLSSVTLLVVGGVTTLGTTPVPAGTVGELIFVANGASAYIRLQNGLSTIGYEGLYDDFQVDLIPGNHGLQATTSAQPKYQTGGLARFDGSDDNLLTTLVPGTAMALIAKTAVPATLSAVRVLIGGTIGTQRCFLGIDTSGRLCAGVGTQGTTTIVGTNDLRSSTVNVSLVFDGTTVKLYEGSTQVYSAAQAGSPGSNPLRLGATNEGGVDGNHYTSDIYHALAIKKALTAAEIAAITNLWGTS